MSKRNFILLIIVLGIAVVSFFLYFYLNPKTPTTDTTSTGTNFIANFNPFGSSKKNPPDTTQNNNTGGDNNVDIQNPDAKLIKISSMPIAGFTVFSKERLKDVPVPPPVDITMPTTTSTTPIPPATTKDASKTIPAKPTPPATEFAPALRYVDKALGNIYQTFVDKIDERKLSDTIIPKVYDAYFGNNAQSVIMRYLKADDTTIETFLGTLPKEILGGDTTSGNEIKGIFLPDNIRDLSLSPNASKLFYLFDSSTGVVGTTINLVDSKKVQLFDSPFTEWLSWWPNDKMITLSTKPSASVAGYMYTLNTDKKTVEKTVGGINGLTTLGSPDGKLVLFSDNNLTLNVFHKDTGNSDLLSIKTMPEKCVWGKVSDTLYCAVPKSINNGQYPDDWYQGSASFNDQIWKVDIKNNTATMLIDPSTVISGDIDGIKLMLDDGENYLFFINKKDSYLWKLNLK